MTVGRFPRGAPAPSSAPPAPTCVVCVLAAVPDIRNAPGAQAAASVALLVLGLADALEQADVEVASVLEGLCAPHTLAYRGGVAELGAQLVRARAAT